MTETNNNNIRNDEDIHKAVEEWCSDPNAAKSKYGDISHWNTRAVTTILLILNNSTLSDAVAVIIIPKAVNLCALLVV